MSPAGDSPVRFYIALMGGAAAALAAALGLLIYSRRKRRSPEEIERMRRLEVNRRGRVTQGQILDLLEPEPGQAGARMVVFKYEVAGVTYEAAQDISALPTVIAKVRRATGLQTRLKYQVDRPTNSIVACEEWSGVPEVKEPEKELGTGS
jgi:hypothetical protein